MSVETFVQPNSDGSQAFDVWTAAVDAAVAVLAEAVRGFAPHASSPAAMTVTIDAGRLFVGGSVVSQAQQTTGTITAPVTHPRIDRIVVDAATGVVSVIAGSENAAPVAPAITAGKLSVAQVALIVGMTEIGNSAITDERGPLVAAILDAIARLSSSGLVARTGAGTVAARTVTGTANQIAVTNGDGVAGDPTIAATVASQGEAEAGTDTTKLMTAERTAQAIAALTVPGGLVPLATVDASNVASVDLTGLTGYPHYIVLVENLYSANDDEVFGMQFSTDNGSSFAGTGYDYTVKVQGTVNGDLDTWTTGAARIPLSRHAGSGARISNQSGEGASFVIHLSHPGDASQYTKAVWTAVVWGAGNDLQIIAGAGAQTTAQDVDALRFAMATGNFYGKFMIFGVTEP